MDIDASPTPPGSRSNRSELERAVLGYEGRPKRRRKRRKTLRSRVGGVEAEWTFVDQIEVRGARYVLAKRELASGPRIDRLTARELEVLRFLAEGHTTKVAAYELGIADATVRVLVVRAIRKLGVSNRREAVECYLEARGR